jgi:hypothetical protein
VPLPESYRRFLEALGAADVRGTEVVGCRRVKLRGTALRQSTDSLTGQFRQWKELRWPRSMICVADDGRGGCYCLDTSKTRRGECPVVYFDHERVAEEKKTGRLVPRLERVAGSFAAWIAGMAEAGHAGPWS